MRRSSPRIRGEHSSLGVSRLNDSCSEKSSVAPGLLGLSDDLVEIQRLRASRSTRVPTIAPHLPTCRLRGHAASPGRFRVLRPDAPSSCSMRNSR